MSKAIQDNNIVYNILSPLVQFGCRCHYRHFDVHGLEKLPKEGAYIIAPCHQQALMEPLAVLNFAPKPPVFLARADIFAKPAIRAILTFLKILPVYRIRDGKDNLSKNADIFNKSRDVLLDGFPLCLMAEGRHNNRHQLLPLVKGMFRIAGETQQRLGEHPLYIVPTGIDFDEYERPYSNLVVNIGDPIPVQPFMEDYANSEPVALNKMRERLSVELRQQMHDIRSQEHYDEIWTLCLALNPRFRKQEGLRNTAWNRFRMRQEISRRCDAMEQSADARFEPLMEKTRRYRSLAKSLKVDPRLPAERWSAARTLGVVLLAAAILAGAIVSPLFRKCLLFALLCYPIPLLPTHLLVRRLIQDTQFRSSINFGIRFLLSILYAIVIGIVMACTGGAWMSTVADIGAWWGLIAVVLVHIEARLSAAVVCTGRLFYSNVRYGLLRLFKGRRVREMENCLREIEL